MLGPKNWPFENFQKTKNVPKGFGNNDEKEILTNMSQSYIQSCYMALKKSKKLKMFLNTSRGKKRQKK